MFKYRHRYCNKCNTNFEYLADTDELEHSCPECGSLAVSPRITAPRVSFTASESTFTPHFDYQLGRHFTSYSEKKAYLDSKDLKQSGGFASPTDSNKVEKKGRPAMTRTQFEAWKRRRKTTAAKKAKAEVKQQLTKVNSQSKKIFIHT